MIVKQELAKYNEELYIYMSDWSQDYGEGRLMNSH